MTSKTLVKKITEPKITTFLVIETLNFLKTRIFKCLHKKDLGILCNLVHVIFSLS